jgi:hypothetical protein
MCNHAIRNYRIISVMFWSFPYLLMHAFGNWSGFVERQPQYEEMQVPYPPIAMPPTEQK